MDVNPKQHKHGTKVMMRRPNRTTAVRNSPRKAAAGARWVLREEGDLFGVLWELQCLGKRRGVGGEAGGGIGLGGRRDGRWGGCI